MATGMVFQGVMTAVLLWGQATGGSIRGTVVESGTGRPVAEARVLVTKFPTRGTSQNGVVVVQTGTLRQLTPVTTDSSGRFVFQNLEFGDYQVRVSAEGYAANLSGNVVSIGGAIEQVTLSDREVSKDLTFRLPRGAALSGRVVGSAGEPLLNMEVSLFTARNDGTGRQTLLQISAALTNDRGEYRLFPVGAGRYYLSTSAPTRSGPNSRGGLINNPKNKYPRLFYPSAADITAAAPIDVLAGGELTGLDFRMNEQAVYRIRGRVVDTNTGQLPRNVGLSITPRESNLNLEVSSNAQVINPGNGTFELQNIPPGKYLIRVQGPLAIGQPLPQTRTTAAIAVAAVEVTNRDVDDVVVAFGPLLSLTGRLRMDDGSAPPAGVRANISLRPAVPPFLGGGSPVVQWNADGTFRISGVEPGEYSASINLVRPGDPRPLSLKEARFGSVDLLTRPFLATGPITDEIVIIASQTPLR